MQLVQHGHVPKMCAVIEAMQLKRKGVPAELKEDLKGKKEFEEYLTKLNLQKADIQGRIEKNKTWIVSC
jgi:hypothetical protein